MISRQADSWYVSLNCEVSDLDHLVPAENQAGSGLIWASANWRRCRTDSKFEAPKPLKNLLGKLKKKQKKFSRAKKGSNNRSKLAVEIALLHRRIGNIRKDALHKLTTFIAANYSEVVIEDLNVKGMMANHCLARAIADIGFTNSAVSSSTKSSFAAADSLSRTAFSELKAMPLLSQEERRPAALGPRMGLSALWRKDRIARPECGDQSLSLSRISLLVVRECSGLCPSGGSSP